MNEGPPAVHAHAPDATGGIRKRRSHARRALVLAGLALISLSLGVWALFLRWRLPAILFCGPLLGEVARFLGRPAPPAWQVRLAARAGWPTPVVTRSFRWGWWTAQILGAVALWSLEGHAW